MTRGQLLGATLVALAACTDLSAADTKAPTARELAMAVQQHAAKVDADRAIVRGALARREVREVADKVGIDLSRIAATIDTLPPSDVATAAQAAQEVNKRLTQENARDKKTGDTRSFVATVTVLIGALLAGLIVVVVH